MKNYEEMSHSVLERRDKYNKHRRTRNTIIAAAACTAVAVGGIGTKIMLDRNTAPLIGNDGITLNAASAGASQGNASGEWQYEYETYEGEGYFVTTLEDGTEIRTPVEVPADVDLSEFLKNAIINSDISTVRSNAHEICHNELWNFHTQNLDIAKRNLGLEEADRVEMSLDELSEYYGVSFVPYDVPADDMSVDELLFEATGNIYQNDERGIYYDMNCLLHNYSESGTALCVTLSKETSEFTTEDFKQRDAETEGLVLSHSENNGTEYFRAEIEEYGTYLSVCCSKDMLGKIYFLDNGSNIEIHYPVHSEEALIHFPMQSDIFENFADLFTESATPADPYSLQFTWVLANQHQKITSQFGYDEWRGGTHNGIDIAPVLDNDSKNILSALDGTVIAAYSDNRWNYGAGNLIIIDHGNGIATVYAHCGEVFVTEGQQVSAGEVIGEVGSTGYSTGENLHFEVRLNGEPIDPFTLKYNIMPDSNETNQEAQLNNIGEAASNELNIPDSDTIPENAAIGELCWPVGSATGGQISEMMYSYGGYYNHKGIDIVDEFGSPIVAADSGTVILASWYYGYGNCVMIQHDNGVITVYGNLSEIRTNVGEDVMQGQLIGDMGSTGQATGTHLHFEVRINDICYNPINYLPWHERASWCVED